MNNQDVGYRATVAKINELIRLAEAKITDAHKHGETGEYWMGVSAGLRRALNVIQGKG